jgi:hypothetical protein
MNNSEATNFTSILKYKVTEAIKIDKYIDSKIPRAGLKTPKL